MGVIRGLVLDESLLVAADEDGNSLLLPEASTLLRRLRYSKLRVGIYYRDDISSVKVPLLTKAARECSFECVPWATDKSDALNKLLLSWLDVQGHCLYATSTRDNDLFNKLSNNGCKIILQDSGGLSTENSTLVSISNLAELLFSICDLNKMVPCDPPLVTVGYIMKRSREEDFAKRGAFPVTPTQNGLMFVPLTFELPLTKQLQEIDVVIHKATDEIVKIDSCASSDATNCITFSKGIQELQRYIEDHSNMHIVDPIANIYPLVDRFRIQEILFGLDQLKKESGCKIRGAHFLKVDNYLDSNIEDKLSAAKLSFPNIVKPQVACGVTDAHSMALVFKSEHFRGLHIPLPAIIQEFVDHGSILYKIYVLGEKVFYAIKKSMPNADILWKTSERNGSSPITFDSLKSLPTANVDLEARDHVFDLGLVTEAAKWLRKQLELTIFGFDVVVQDRTGDHVIVDVNYLPSFKEVPDDEAMPAFWDAIRGGAFQSKECRCDGH